MLLLVLPIVLASHQITGSATVAVETAGTTPDSILYGIDVALNNIQLALTFDSGEKARKGLEIAQERLLEVKEMISQNKLEAAQKAQEKHSDVLKKVQEAAQEIEEDSSVEEMTEVVELELELEEHTEEVEQTFGELRVKIEIEGELTPEQRELIDAILSNLKGMVGEVEIEIDSKKNKVKIKIEQETGESGEEVEQEIEETVGLHGFQKEHAENMRLKAEDKWVDVVEKAEKFSLEVPDKSSFDGLIALGDEAFALGEYELAKDYYEEAKDLAEDLKDVVEESGEAEEEREIQVKITEEGAEVEIEIGDSEWEFELDTTDVNVIVSEIAARVGLSEDEVNAIINIKTDIAEEEEEVDEEDEEMAEEEADDDEDDNDNDEDEDDDEESENSGKDEEKKEEAKEK